MENRKKLDQFFTPVWAAEMLFMAHFSHLTEKDLVWEPSCGNGSWLSVIPENIPAIGNDIDPKLAKEASKNTGRPVSTGDFRHVTFDKINQVTAICGNPPFKLNIFEQFMQRCENILTLGNKAGFILPAYFFQTSGTFMRFARRWEIKQEIIPRDLFKGEGVLSKPLIFAAFIRDNFPKIFGFRLHAELCDINTLKESVKEILSNKINKPGGSVWREAVIDVVKDAGGRATLDELYNKMQNKRPTENQFWKEQVRKIVQQAPFQKVGDATYQLNAA